MVAQLTGIKWKLQQQQADQTQRRELLDEVQKGKFPALFKVCTMQYLASMLVRHVLLCMSRHQLSV